MLLQASPVVREALGARAHPDLAPACAAAVRRALALKQITNRDIPRIVLKEAGAGCMMGERLRRSAAGVLTMPAAFVGAAGLPLGQRRGSCPNMLVGLARGLVAACHPGSIPGGGGGASHMHHTRTHTLNTQTHTPRHRCRRRRAGPGDPGVQLRVVGHLHTSGRGGGHCPPGEARGLAGCARFSAARHTAGHGRRARVACARCDCPARRLQRCQAAAMRPSRPAVSANPRSSCPRGPTGWAPSSLS